MSSLPPADYAAMRRAATIEGGGFGAFTAHFLSPIGEEARWDLVHQAPDSWDLEPGQYVPWVPYNWQFVIAHDSRMDCTIIGGVGCGKTIAVGGAGLYWCFMTPNFKFMNCAPTGWQSKQMYDKIRYDLIDWENREDRPRYITRYISRIIERPYPVIELWNGSSLEFMSGDEHGAKIRSWEGDAASIDEAGLMGDLDELLINLGSRTRGMTSGRPRMGKLILLSNADYSPEMWEQYDMAERLPQYYFSLHLETDDNPAITTAQYDAIARRIKDPERRRQMMKAERPLPQGKEFSRSLLELSRDASLDEDMEYRLENDFPGYVKESMERAGVWRWETPAAPQETYILIGDPGQGCPPNRNSPCIGVIRCTNFPNDPASLAAFWWGDGKGSYWPFIYQFENYARAYLPVYSAFDSTGAQKAFDELVFQQRGIIVEGLNMQYQKLAMANALKLIMGKGLLKMPGGIAGIWLQLAGWHMPDKKLRQDIAMMLFMGAHLLQRLFVLTDITDDAMDAYEDVDSGRNVDQRLLRPDRHGRIER